MPIDVGMTITDLAVALRHGHQVEILWLAFTDFVPAQRRRHPGIRLRPDRVRAGDRAVLCILVVVEEHAVPFFLPPFAGGERGSTTFNFTSEGESGAANFSKDPPALESRIHMNAAGP